MNVRKGDLFLFFCTQIESSQKMTSRLFDFHLFTLFIILIKIRFHTKHHPRFRNLDSFMSLNLETKDIFSFFKIPTYLIYSSKLYLLYIIYTLHKYDYKVKFSP